MKGFIHLNIDVRCSIAWEDREQTITLGLYDEEDDYGTIFGEILIEFREHFNFIDTKVLEVANEVRFSNEAFPLMKLFADLFNELTLYSNGITIGEFKNLLIKFGFEDLTLEENKND